MHKLIKLRVILLVVCCAVFTVSLYYLARYASGYFRQKRLEDNQAEIVAALPPPPLPVSISSQNQPVLDSNVNTDPDGQPAQTAGQSAETAGKAVETTDTADGFVLPKPDYKSRFQTILDEVNEDFYGLLSIPGLGGGLSGSFVVQGEDNTYYLDKSIDRSSNERGTLFLDYKALPWFESNNYVIFGHNMKDGTMFHDVPDYYYIDTYLRAPVIEFDTIYGPTTWLIFAAYVCEYDFDYYHAGYSGPQFEELLREIFKRSNYHTGVEVLPSDTILTLSTCEYTFQEARFVVHARLLRENESLEDFTPAAEANNDKQRPTVPDEISLSDIPANRTAFTQLAGMRRNYFFQPDSRFEGIIWYTGSSMANVQGPYYAWNGSINTSYFSWLAAASYYLDGLNRFYIVSGGLQGGAPGLYVLNRNYIPSEPYMFKLVSDVPITPAGVDARWPVIYLGRNNELTVIYTVTSEGITAFYSIPVDGGTPALVCEAEESLDSRPGSVIETEDGTVLLIQDFTTGAIRALYLDSGTEPVLTGLPARFGRFTAYLDADSGYRYLCEENGILFSGRLDMTAIPRKPQQGPEADPGAQPQKDSEPRPE